MITKMTKYTFLLLHSDTEEFLREIQELGVIDITRSRKPVDAASGHLYREAEELRHRIETIERCDYARDEQHAALTAQLHTAEAALAEKRLWGDMDPVRRKELEQAGFRFHFYTVPVKRFKDAWRSDYALAVIAQDDKNVRFVLVGTADETAPIPVPETVLAQEPVQVLAERVASLKRAVSDREEQMQEQKKEIPALQRACTQKTEELQRYLAQKGSGRAAEDFITVLTGFAPSQDDLHLKTELDRKAIYYVSEPATAADNPPIQLRNNGFARNFETLTGMYGMPVYDEFDPTPVLAPFFLLFWAFCMGDAGYGLLLILVGLLLDKVNIMGLRKHKRLVLTLGVGTTVVGLFLGTFFGINLKEVAWIPEGLRKLMLVGKIQAGAASYDIAMVAAIAIGVFHICLAMIIKAVGQTRRAGFREAVSTWGWVVLIVGGLLVGALAFTQVLNAAATKVAVILVAVLSVLGIFIFNKPGRNPLLNVGAGLWDTYQMATGILGDVLSYIRLYALGLAGGMLGAAFNNLGGMVLGANPTWQWLPFVLIVLIGHALNFAMSCLGAFVHPLRLTFVEYFKNSGYEGKGMEYSPLTKKLE